MQSSPIVVIAGTDTGVGKTWTGCGLARALRAAGRRVLAIKPIETGCSGPPADAEDGVLLARATGQAEPACALLRLAAPVTPAEAADREGARVDLDALAGEIRRRSREAEITLVEGAGGLLSPLSWDETAVDLARRLDARVLVVAADRLGTLNHALLTLKWLEASRIDTLGLVLTAPEEPDASTGSNAAALARCAPGLRLRPMPRTNDPEVILPAMGEVAGWLGLGGLGP